MELGEYKNVRAPLEDVRAMREEFERRENEKPKSMEDSLAALLQKHGSKTSKKAGK